MLRLIAGLVAVFALFQWVAIALGSDRGQAGVLVALVVVSATLAVERWLFGGTLRAAARAIGLGIPRLSGLVVASASCVSLGFVLAAFMEASAASLTYDGTSWLLAGLFAQAGVAEESLFRGYLFGHLRRRLPFWHACFASMIPFVAIHLWLFISLPWPLAFASILLAAATSIPLAHLFELGGHTIWPPAFLHFTIQSVPKLFIPSDDATSTFPLTWMAASGILPLLVLLIRVRLPRARNHSRIH
jgi:membrane protease YdiL (CAAX protease family)